MSNLPPYAQVCLAYESKQYLTILEKLRSVKFTKDEYKNIARLANRDYQNSQNNMQTAWCKQIMSLCGKPPKLNATPEVIEATVEGSNVTVKAFGQSIKDGSSYVINKLTNLAIIILSIIGVVTIMFNVLGQETTLQILLLGPVSLIMIWYGFFRQSSKQADQTNQTNN